MSSNDISSKRNKNMVARLLTEAPVMVGIEQVIKSRELATMTSLKKDRTVNNLQTYKQCSDSSQRRS